MHNLRALSFFVISSKRRAIYEPRNTIPLGDKDSYWGMYYQMHMPDGLSINKDNLDLLRQCQFVPEWYTDGICNALRDGVPRITVRW